MIPTNFARIAPHGVLEYKIKYVNSSSVMVINKESSSDYSVCECRMCVLCDKCNIDSNDMKCEYSNYSIEVSSIQQHSKCTLHIKATCTVYNTANVADTVAAAEALMYNWILLRASGVICFSAWYIMQYKLCCTYENTYGILHCELNNGILYTHADSLRVCCSATNKLHTITLSNNSTVVIEPLSHGVVILHDYDTALDQYITAHCTDTTNYPQCVYDAYDAFCSEIVHMIS